MKRVYLIHCWDGTCDDGWYPWLKKQLEANNIEVIMENMPNTEAPTIDSWVSKLNDLVDKLDENTYFIGHSIGGQTIMRYLEAKDITTIGGILFVAPWLDLLPEALIDGADMVAKPWMEEPIDFDKIKKFTDNITCIFSDDDYFVSIEQENEFKSILNAKTVILENKGHISVEDGINELPDILIESGRLLGLELIEVVDEEANILNVLDKDIVHERGLLHKEVGIFIFNDKKQTLLQKRSSNKRHFPGAWTVCAGHVDAYESNLDAMAREIKEELGVNVDLEKIKYLTTTMEDEGLNKYISYTYYTFIEKKEEEFTIQESELTEVKWVNFKDFVAMVTGDNNNTVFTPNESYMRVFAMLEKVLGG